MVIIPPWNVPLLENGRRSCLGCRLLLPPITLGIIIITLVMNKLKMFRTQWFLPAIGNFVRRFTVIHNCLSHLSEIKFGSIPDILCCTLCDTVTVSWWWWWLPDAVMQGRVGAFFSAVRLQVHCVRRWGWPAKTTSITFSIWREQISNEY